MPRRTAAPARTPDRQDESDRPFTALQQAAAEDLRALADVLATKDDTNTLGATEFTLRDIVLRVAAKAVETALEGRKKGGTRGPAGPAPTAANPPSSSGGRPARS